MKLWASPKGDANNIRGSDRIIAGYRGMEFSRISWNFLPDSGARAVFVHEFVNLPELGLNDCIENASTVLGTVDVEHLRRSPVWPQRLAERLQGTRMRGRAD